MEKVTILSVVGGPSKKSPATIKQSKIRMKDIFDIISLRILLWVLKYFMSYNSINMWKIFNLFRYYTLNMEIISILTSCFSFYSYYCIIQFIMESQFKKLNCKFIVLEYLGETVEGKNMPALQWKDVYLWEAFWIFAYNLLIAAAVKPPWCLSEEWASSWRSAEGILEIGFCPSGYCNVHPAS